MDRSFPSWKGVEYMNVANWQMNAQDQDTYYYSYTVFVHYLVWKVMYLALLT